MQRQLSYISLVKIVCCYLLFCAVLPSKKAVAQCIANVTMYPYEEDFENNDGGWTSGGDNSDWAWGMPVKRIIKDAGSGSKCWITGGLTKTGYNDNESSYLQSPCFDLTNLSYPYISFKLFCDTEAGLDGANLQYSPDNGSTWIKVGKFGQPQDCFNSGWYNNRSIQFLSTADGWSSPDKSGGQWSVSQILLPFTGGDMKKVMFRFYFGAGSKSNTYDGFAVDDFFMGEAPVAAQASFGYTCLNASSASFTAQAAPCLSQLQWNFNDFVSGVSNVASGTTVTHTFSAPGIYGVRLTATGNNGEEIIKIKQVSIIKATAKTITPVACGGSTALVQAVVEGNDDLNYQYRWHALPEITTATATLPAGSYTLEVSADNSCTATAPITIEKPAALQLNLGHDTAICNGEVLILNAGNFATFTWDDLSSQPQRIIRKEGIYHVTVKDTNGCEGSDTINIIAGCGAVYFPSAFTPNGDFFNDFFGPLGNVLPVTNYTLQIYNRPGALVFKSVAPAHKWNGRYKNYPAVAGTYLYIAQFKYNGTSIIKRGTVTVLL